MEIATGLFIVGGIIAVCLILYIFPVNLWFTAYLSCVKVSLINLVLMRLRKVPPALVVNTMITSTKDRLNLTANEIETHYLDEGNVNNVIKALNSADKANIPLDFKMATAIDRAGSDVSDAVQLSVTPRVIDTPPAAAVAKDGIQLIAKARVTVR